MNFAIESGRRLRVVRAEAMGLCFGVRDALAAAASVDRPAEVTIFGELVHNATVRSRLAQRGFAATPEHDRTRPQTRRVMVTAHGISERRRRELLAAGHELIDTTCPLVRKAHDAAQRLAAERRHVLVIGKPDHVEVRGIVEDLPSYDVVPTPEATRRYGFARLGAICQTTTAPRDAAAVLDAVRRLNQGADLRVIDTICAPTRQRQAAMDRLLDEVDAVVVVGGANSNNTHKLVALCAARGVGAWRVEDAHELDPGWFRDVETIGLTAGTSTPDDAIERVERALLAMNRCGEQG